MESRVSAGCPQPGSRLSGRVCAEMLLSGRQQFSFTPFRVTGCRTSVPRVTVADCSFPGRSVPYHRFFVLHPSRFLSYTHQGFFVLPAAPHQQGFSRAYQECLRAPAKEMSFFVSSLPCCLCDSSVRILYYTLRQE